MSEEELLLKRIKVIGDGEFTLLGTPDELIKEFHSYTQEKCREARIDELSSTFNIVDGRIFWQSETSLAIPLSERIAELQAQLNKSKGE